MRVLNYPKDTNTYAINDDKRERALMTKQPLAETKETITVAVQPTLGQRVAAMIDDPFGSVIIATAITTLAIASVLAGLGIVNLVLY